MGSGAEQNREKLEQNAPSPIPAAQISAGELKAGAETATLGFFVLLQFPKE